jgi:hypothetical protein
MRTRGKKQSGPRLPGGRVVARGPMLGDCVMYGITGVTLLQLRRLLGASGHADQLAYTESSADAEAQLRQWQSGVALGG